MISRFTLLALLLLSATASAQTPLPPSNDATQQARSHFQAGLSRAQQGDLVAALREFETAYESRPHFSVLYNIALTRSTLGHPVEAVEAFERYLADGGPQVAPARRQEVDALLAANRSRIGRLQVFNATDDTRVWLDGIEIAPSKLNAPIAVATGEHSVVYANKGSPPDSRVIAVTNSEVVELRLMPPPKTSMGVAQLAIKCRVPGVDVEIVGVTRAKTPVPTPLLVPDGALVVRFSRPGYVTSSQSLTTKNGELHTVQCSQHEATPLPRTLAARLVVRAVPADAEVMVDGRRFLGTVLPAGVHQLRVERDGFGAHERMLSLSAGKLAKYNATLAPTPATRERQHRASARRRTAGLVLGGVGAALLATGAGIYTWNSGRYDDWRAGQAQPGSATNLQRATSIQRADDASVGLFVLGGGLIVGGAWLFFWQR
jgi:hypothetical protein